MKQFISPRTGKPVPGAFVCSNAELQNPHYQALKNPAYRQELWNMRHESEHEPSNASLFGEARPPSTASVKQAGQAGQPNNQRLDRIQGELIALRDTLTDHLKGKKAGDII